MKLEIYSHRKKFGPSIYHYWNQRRIKMKYFLEDFMRVINYNITPTFVKLIYYIDMRMNGKNNELYIVSFTFLMQYFLP